MEREERKTTEETAKMRRKANRAMCLLLFRSHIKPGVKGWELKRALGRNYLEVLDFLKDKLEELGLTIKRIDAEKSHNEEEGRKPSESTFFITLKEHPSTLELKGSGWRIDDLAILAATTMYIVSRRGRAPLKEIKRLLETKFLKWRIEYNLNRFKKMGYLLEDDKGNLYVGWRTIAEVDQRTLLNTLLGTEKPQ